MLGPPPQTRPLPPQDNFEPTSILVEKQAQMRERGDRRSGGRKSPSFVNECINHNHAGFARVSFSAFRGVHPSPAPAPSVYAPAVRKLWSVVTSATLHETNSCRCAEVAVTASVCQAYMCETHHYTVGLYRRIYRNTSTNPNPNGIANPIPNLHKCT